MENKNKVRLIFSCLFLVATFFIMIFSELPLLPSFIFGIIASGLVLLITDPNFEQWNKERKMAFERRKEYERNISRDEYLREKARLDARNHFRDGWTRPLRFGSKPRAFSPIVNIPEVSKMKFSISPTSVDLFGRGRKNRRK